MWSPVLRTDLFVHKGARLRDVEGRSDTDSRAIQVTWAYLGDMTAAVYFFILLPVLVVVVRLEGEFGPTDSALETSRMEEAEIFQRPYPVDLVDSLIAAETGAFVEIDPIHD